MSKSTVHFVIRFGIPWIWKWDFQCVFQNKVPCLKRACWDASPKLLPVTSVQNPFVQIQNELRQKFPELSE
ncbi:hypothetical protein ACSBR2_018679 [Camellia fascicularis]